MKHTGLFGYFTHEAIVERHKYDTQKNEKIYVDQPFEDIFFILHVETSLCLIQERKFHDSNLSMSLIHENFSEALKIAFDKSDIEFHGLIEVSRVVSKDKFIEIFDTHNITSIKINNLKGATVPENFKILNPDFEKEPIVRAVFDKAFKFLDVVSLRGTEEGGLQNSKFNKTFLVTGDPEEMEYYEETKKHPKKLTKKLGPSLKLDIDIESPDEDQILDEIERHFSNATKTLIYDKKKQYQTTLFSWDQNEK